MKKLTVMALSVVLIGVMAIGGSLAYFTDTVTTANNVITAGSVQIAQLEYQRSADGTTLVPYEQYRPCYPNYAQSDESYIPSITFAWGDYVTADDAHSMLWDPAKLPDVVDKFVFVKNEGRSPAYCRTLIALECPATVTYGTTNTASNDNVDIMLNLNFDGIQWTTLADKITVDGIQYQVMTATYQDVIKAKETAMPSLLQLVMTDNVTNREALAMGDTYEILVLTQACQTTTFIDADEATLDGKDRATYALDTCFEPVTKTSAETWFYTMLHPQTDDATNGTDTTNDTTDNTQQEMP